MKNEHPVPFSAHSKLVHEVRAKLGRFSVGSSYDLSEMLSMIDALTKSILNLAGQKRCDNHLLEAIGFLPISAQTKAEVSKAYQLLEIAMESTIPAIDIFEPLHIFEKERDVNGEVSEQKKELCYCLRKALEETELFYSSIVAETKLEKTEQRIQLEFKL